MPTAVHLKVERVGTWREGRMVKRQNRTHNHDSPDTSAEPTASINMAAVGGVSVQPLPHSPAEGKRGNSHRQHPYLVLSPIM